MSEPVTTLSVRNLLSGATACSYLIPMYQRNYAWGEAEITQLLQDILDYMPQQGGAPRTYYIGTLVVREPDSGHPAMYEVIDGQQRLTTLSLLAAFLRKEIPDVLTWPDHRALDFEIRQRSRATLNVILQGEFENDPAEKLTEAQTNSALLNGYRLIKRILPQKVKDHSKELSQLAGYLFDWVHIMRVAVPPHIDRNQYFEIMNSRGEQLETHEVLKARLLAVLEKGIVDTAENAAALHCLHRVWEACANMQKYVQKSFTTAERDAVFGKEDWSALKARGFDELCRALNEAREKEARENEATPDEKELPVSKIIAATALTGNTAKGPNDGRDQDERFNSVISFPHFLLQVLRVLTESDIPLDDKVLIHQFEQHLLKASDPVGKVQQFTFALLRCKYLLDHYVIKRRIGVDKGSWSLERLKRKEGTSRYVNTFGEDADAKGINRRILMLQAALHVSNPAPAYKHWLNAALYHLYYAERVEAASYLRYLESVARAFVFDRYLAPGRRKEYFEIIYQNAGTCMTRRQDLPDAHLDAKLSFGNIENNLVFNYLDYLLWLELDDPAVQRDFEFTFRSSVEHYSPQTPHSGKQPIANDRLNAFGNLCLISTSNNSRLGNLWPEAKKGYYRDRPLRDSIKQYLMMQVDDWKEDSIHDHHQAMKRVLLSSLTQDENVSGHLPAAV